MCPAELKPYEKAYELYVDKKDEEMWIQGMYEYHAFATVMAEFGAGLSGKSSKAKYLEKPLRELSEDKFLKNNQDRKEYKYMTDEEKQKAELEKAKSYFDSLVARF